MISIQKCNTISQLIEYGKALDLSHAKLHLKSSFINNDGNTVIINYTSILDKYYDFLQKIITEVTLSDKEYAKWKFQPKRLCFEIYGTTELWSAILSINNLTSASQFTNKKIKLFTMDIFEVINEISILEKNVIAANNAENNL